MKWIAVCIFPKHRLLKCAVQQFMDRGQYMRCHILLISHPAVQCSNCFWAKFCQPHVPESRENVVSNQRYMIGIRRIGPMSLSIEFYILLKQLRQIAGIAL